MRVGGQHGDWYYVHVFHFVQCVTPGGDEAGGRGDVKLRGRSGSRMEVCTGESFCRDQILAEMIREDQGCVGQECFVR